MARNESDSAWKEVLDAYFKDFMDYCLPQVSELIDWAKPCISLDKELQAITKGREAGKRILDKLFKVYLKNGLEQWILVHLEVQGSEEDGFAKRVFTYSYRIYDKYQRPVLTCAILTDNNKGWRPTSYEVGLAGKGLKIDFFAIKLIDYKNKQTELEASSNPFASVILVQLAALAAKSKPDKERKQVKYALTKRLYEKGLSKNEVINLYKFIDWLIGLPEPLELEYLNEVYELEGAKKMAYISTAERFGIEQGIHAGLQKAVVVLEMLSRGEAVAAITQKTGLSIEEIELLKKSMTMH